MPATNVRPGRVIKAYLEANGVGFVSEMHRAYKADIEAERKNQADRGAMQRRRSMTYDSFRKYLYAARALGLIERTGETVPLDDTLMTSPGAMSMVVDGQVQPVQPVCYALTDAGRDEDADWDDLGKALNTRRA